MNSHRVPLLDVDGVLLDNHKWAVETARVTGDAAVPMLGGQEEIWGTRHQHVWDSAWSRANETYKFDLGLRRMNLSRWWDWVHADWIVQMCAEMGLQPPVSFEERVDTAERIYHHVYTHADIVFPGSREAILDLDERFEIHTASGNPGWVVETVLDGLGVRDRIGMPFGSDLADLQKGDDRFNPIILEAIGADPTEVVLVDDDDRALVAARRHGITAVKMGTDGEGDLTISRLSDLSNLDV